MNKISIISVALLFGLMSCDDEEVNGPLVPIDSNPSDLEIRINNTSNYKLDSVYLNTSGGEAHYEAINPNQKSSYEAFDFSYNYFYLRFKVNEKQFVLQPIDYVGETKVNNTRYSIRISAVDTLNKTFNFLLVTD